MSLNILSSVDEIIQIFKQRGHSNYGGEAVTQAEHALQTAYFAERVGASAELISAALLHDFGHLLHELPENAPDDGIDDFHEVAAEKPLSKLFPQSVIEPICLHVKAKRYLCSTDKNYFSILSEASVTSLRLQGGTMSKDEIEEFESHVYWRDAIRVRKWDDLAKDPEVATPAIDHYAPILEAASL